LAKPLLQIFVKSNLVPEWVNNERFTANQVGSLRRYRNIPRFQPSADPPIGELVSIRKAAQILGMNTSSIHRWLADGFIAGEQVTPGAPWQIRITDELRARIVQQAPPEYLPMLETTMKLGVSRQTVLQRVKRGELQAVLVRQGRRKGLRIKSARFQNHGPLGIGAGAGDSREDS